MLDWLAANAHLIAWLLLVPVVPILLLQVLTLLILMERRGAAFIQDRPGPNRAAIAIPGLGLRIRGFGMVFNLADPIKLFTKEDWVPPFAHRGYFLAAPMVPIITAMLVTALVPWFAPIAYRAGGGLGWLDGQLLAGSSGILMLFAVSSLSVYGVVLGAWASNSKFSLLGGLRGSAMMVSYEVSMGLAAMGMLLVVGSLSLQDAVQWQGAHTWGIVVQPLGFLLFLAAMFAECNRNPFDVIEGESEIIAGFHTEYSAIKFTLFMMGEYLHMLLAGVLLAVLFLGGWQLLPFPLPIGPDGEWRHLDGAWTKAHLGPVLAVALVGTAALVAGFAWLVAGRRRAYLAKHASDAAQRGREYGFYIAVFSAAAAGLLAAAGLAWGWRPQAELVAGVPVYSGWADLACAVLQFHIVLGKALLFCFLFVWVRWTLPRFRYDQIMALGWKVLLNAALVNLVATAVVLKLVRS